MCVDIISIKMEELLTVQKLLHWRMEKEISPPLVDRQEANLKPSGAGSSWKGGVVE